MDGAHSGLGAGKHAVLHVQWSTFEVYSVCAGGQVDPVLPRFGKILKDQLLHNQAIPHQVVKDRDRDSRLQESRPV